MQSSLQYSWMHFYSHTLDERLERLRAEHKMLVEREQELLAQQSEFQQQQQQLITRRTVHELQCRLFWLELKKSNFRQLNAFSSGCPKLRRDV